MRTWLVLLAVASAGCTTSTGALMRAPGIYSVRAEASPGAGGISRAMRDAHADAERKCAELGGTLLPAKEDGRDAGFFNGMAVYELVFTCSPPAASAPRVVPVDPAGTRI